MSLTVVAGLICFRYRVPVRWTAGNLPFSEVLASLAVLFVAIMGVTT